MELATEGEVEDMAHSQMNEEAWEYYEMLAGKLFRWRYYDEPITIEWLSEFMLDFERALRKY